MEEQYNYQNPMEQKPDNFLVWSILSTVLCCLPLGIVAIIYSTKVDSLWQQGDKNGAIDAAKKAKMFCLIAVGCGIFALIVSFIIGVIGGLMS